MKRPRKILADVLGLPAVASRAFQDKRMEMVLWPEDFDRGEGEDARLHVAHAANEAFLVVLSDILLPGIGNPGAVARVWDADDDVIARMDDALRATYTLLGGDDVARLMTIAPITAGLLPDCGVADPVEEVMGYPDKDALVAAQRALSWALSPRPPRGDIRAQEIQRAVEMICIVRREWEDRR